MSLDGIKAGWIGTGNMGSPMSRCLIGAGASVAVFDPAADNMSASVAAGARAGTSNRDAAADAEIADAVRRLYVATAASGQGADNLTAAIRQMERQVGLGEPE